VGNVLTRGFRNLLPRLRSEDFKGESGENGKETNSHGRTYAVTIPLLKSKNFLPLKNLQPRSFERKPIVNGALRGRGGGSALHSKCILGGMGHKSHLWGTMSG